MLDFYTFFPISESPLDVTRNVSSGIQTEYNKKKTSDSTKSMFDRPFNDDEEPIKPIDVQDIW